MKKAFDQNVSRSKPRLKLGAPSPEPAAPADEAWVYEVAAQVAGQQAPAELPTAREVLADADHATTEVEEASTRSRVEATLREAAAAEPVEEERVTVAAAARARGTTAANGVLPPGSPVAGPARRAPEVDARPAARAPVVSAPVGGAGSNGSGSPASDRRPSTPVVPQSAAPSRGGPPVAATPSSAVQAPARAAAPVRTEAVVAPATSFTSDPRRGAPPPDDTAARRERLRERLRSVREHPRPEPLPTSVAAAGVLAVERIAQLQTELNAMKQHNAALQHDLDVARRAAERATEEARARVEEARRLVAQMEERGGLLSELERELQSVEGERDEALLAVQDARTSAAAEREERERLSTLVGTKDVELADSLSEEERLAGELERFRDESVHLRKSVEVLSAERDTLARQVADLTTERAELLEARKALESVHRALTEAAQR
jgi:hypothetical protein